MNQPLTDTNAPAPGMLLEKYGQLIRSRGLRDDAAQRSVLQKLENLKAGLLSPAPANPSLIGKIFGRESPQQAMKGLYLWGNVGRGKSMLMDLFFENTPVPSKRRVHFHAFMQEVHASMHELRKQDKRDGKGTDPVLMLAGKIAGETRLLCFDELQATDVADATLLYRLFNALFEQGVTIVSTSNHPPESLYTGGIQRERFNKFIALINEHMDVVALSSPHDYRHMQVKSIEQRYFYPLGAAADAFVEDSIKRLAKSAKPTKEKLLVQGRSLQFAMYDGSIGRFTFADLCENPLGAADYLAIAKACDMVILTGIPKLSAEKRNEAKRFVTLIDALYEHRIDLLCTAAVAPDQLYSTGDGAFEFKRTVSRLAEMQSANWGD